MSVGLLPSSVFWKSLRGISVSSLYVWQPSGPVLSVCGGFFFLITNSVSLPVKVLYKLCFLLQFSGAVCFQNLVHFFQVVEFFGIYTWAQYSLSFFVYLWHRLRVLFHLLSACVGPSLCSLVSLVRGLSLQFRLSKNQLFISVILLQSVYFLWSWLVPSADFTFCLFF